MPPTGRPEGRPLVASRLFCLQNLPPAAFAAAKVPEGEAGRFPLWGKWRGAPIGDDRRTDAQVYTVGLLTKGAIKRARASDLARSARRKDVKIWRASFSLELRACAACGRKSKPGISAAVEKRKDQRKPAAFFGHRKVESKNRFSFHKRKEKWVLRRFLRSPFFLLSKTSLHGVILP